MQGYDPRRTTEDWINRAKRVAAERDTYRRQRDELVRFVDCSVLNDLLGQVEDSGDTAMWAAAKAFREVRDDLLGRIEQEDAKQ